MLLELRRTPVMRDRVVSGPSGHHDSPGGGTPTWHSPTGSNPTADRHAEREPAATDALPLAELEQQLDECIDVDRIIGRVLVALEQGKARGVPALAERLRASARFLV